MTNFKPLGELTEEEHVALIQQVENKLEADPTDRFWLAMYQKLQSPFVSTHRG